MKILLLTLLFFAALVAPAQDKPSPPDVLIPLPVATFFLEQNEKAKLLQVQVDSLHADVKQLELLDSTRLKQLATEEKRKVEYDSLVELQSGEIEGCHKSEAALTKELKKQKRNTRFVTIGGIILLILASSL